MDRDVTLRCLISRGANITDKTQAGWTALNESIEHNSHACLSILLESGADLSAVDSIGQTVLHIIARRGDQRTMVIFQAADLEGLNAEAKTKEGFTAWDLMRQRVDATDEVQSAFQILMSKLDSRNSCVTYFDALEKLPPIGKIPERIEVKVVEILVN